MRVFLIFILVLFLFLPNCLFAQKNELDNLRPYQIWNLVINHYDPEDKWHQISGSLHAISIRPNGKLISEDIIINNLYKTYKTFLFQGDSVLMRRKQGRFIGFSVNGKKDLNLEEQKRLKLTPQDIDFIKRRHLFEIGLPMYLKAAEIQFKPEIKEGKFNGSYCLILESTGTTPKTKKDYPFIQQSIFYYINPDDYSLLGMEFPLEIKAQGIPGYRIIYNGEIELNGVKIPQVKNYFNYKNNTYSYTTMLQPFTISEYIDKEAEKETISRLVNDEIQYFQLGNYNDWAACWSHQNDVYHSYVSQNRYLINEGWKKVSSFAKNFFEANLDPHKLAIVPDNFTYHIYDNFAWVYFDSQVGSQIQGRHQKILRKENGKWKIFNWTGYDENSYQDN